MFLYGFANLSDQKVFLGLEEVNSKAVYHGVSETAQVVELEIHVCVLERDLDIRDEDVLLGEPGLRVIRALKVIPVVLADQLQMCFIS